MEHFMLRTLMTLTLLSISTPAFAHLGHVGELAGHAHWVGLGAVIVAGALAAAIGKVKNANAEEEVDEDEAELGEEASVEG